MELKLLKETIKTERRQQKEAKQILEKKILDLQQLIDKISLENKNLIIAKEKLTFQNAEHIKKATKLAMAKSELIFKDELTAYHLRMAELAQDLTRLIKTANAPIFGIDHKGLVNEWNQTSEKITGFKKHEVIGKKFVENFITKEYQKAVKKVLDQALIGKETASYEFPMYSKDGVRNMMLLNSTSRRDKKNNIIGVLGVGQDITEIDKLRTTLKDSAFRLKLVMESLGEATWGRSLPDYKLRYISSSVVSLYGFPVADWHENMHLWSDMIHPDDIKRVNKENEVLFTSGKCEIEFRILTANKQIKHINSKIIIIKNKDGIPFFMTGRSRDITEQKKDKDQLKYLNSSLVKKTNKLQISNSRLKEDIIEINKLKTSAQSIAKELRQFIETANAPIFGIDNKGLVNEWNQTSEKITGFAKNEVLGKDLVQNYITKEYQKAVKTILNDALIGKETANYEFPLYTKGGERVMVLLNSTTRRDHKNNIIGVLGVGQDITELVTYRKELELQVKQRTLNLNDALKEQKRLTELKSQFISTTSHEFRTPLAAINFAAGSLKKYLTKMEPILIKKKLNKIEDQVLHMTKLLDDVLNIGKVEKNKKNKKTPPMNLGDFMYEIIEEVDDSFEKSHEIVLIDILELKNSTIFIDKKLGRSIFINVLSNAIKFSPNAKKIIIELSSEKSYTVISVTDFGIGIPKAELKNIFNPFTRGENVSLINGTGLGLSIVKKTIDIIGGKIIVNSNIGHGTTFIIKIPKN